MSNIMFMTLSTFSDFAFRFSFSNCSLELF